MDKDNVSLAKGGGEEEGKRTTIVQAVQQGLGEAARTLRGISGIEIHHWTVDVENNRITRYKVTMNVAFAIEHSSPNP